jgi:multiple sugar transport system permease protein
MTVRETPLSAPQGAEALAVAEGSNAPDAPMRHRGGRRAVWAGVGRYFARGGWAHVVLLAGVGVFLLPFVWMVAMSLKTDDEAGEADFWPAVPTFRAASPAVRPTAARQPPDGATPERWKAIEPVLLTRAAALVAARPLPAGGDAVDPGALRSAAAAAVVDAAADQMRATVWAEPDAAITAAFDAVATPEVVDGALNEHLGRLEITGLEVHDEATRAYPVVPKGAVLTAFHVESGAGQLLPLPNGGGAYLKYHFASGSDAPVVLRADFTAPVAPADLHNLVLSYRGDDSWHRIDATMTVGDAAWASTLTTYVAQYRQAAITFQPPSYEDESYQNKTWVPMRPTAEATDARPGLHATLRLTLSPSSTLRAIGGKVARNYRRAFRSVPFWTYVGNSLLLVALNVAGATFSAALVGYAFARLNWPGRSVAFGLLLATMMLPAQVTMIPSFVIWRALGWYNTLNPLWITAWTGSAFFIFLMVQFMRTIPKELEEAARIDGLNAVQTWWYVMVPLVKPTLAAIAIMVFMASWNDFLGPLVMLRDQAKFPLSLGLFGLNIDQKQTAGWAVIMAGNMLMTLPVIGVFFLFQRYFIEGVTVSGMKG